MVSCFANLVCLIFLKKPTYFPSPIARNKKIIPPAIQSHFERGEDLMTANKSICTNRSTDAKKHSNPIKSVPNILGRKTGNLLSSLVGRAAFSPQLPPNAQKTCNIPITINIRDVIPINIFINLPPRTPYLNWSYH